MKNILIYLVSAVCLAGCAITTKIVGPNGQPAWAIRCGGDLPDICLAKAGELCPNGYNVVNSRDSQYIGNMANANMSGSKNGFSGSAISMPMLSPNSLVVECKPPK